jgi:hypothetical protein
MNQGFAAYKAFIDGLVELAKRESSTAFRLRHGQQLVPAPYLSPDGVEQNRLAEELSPEQHEFVAKLVQEERQAAVGDVLAFLTWQHYQLSKDGIDLAFEPFGTENYYDFVCRLNGDAWPEDDSQPEEK